MSLVPTVRQIRDKAQQAAILNVAREDNDSIMFPSHVVMKDGKIAGAASLGVIPLVCCWHHSQLIGPKDSLILKSIYDAIMENRGTPNYFIACNARSPYTNFMEKFGYNPIWETKIFTNNGALPETH